MVSALMRVCRRQGLGEKFEEKGSESVVVRADVRGRRRRRRKRKRKRRRNTDPNVKR